MEHTFEIWQHFCVLSFVTSFYLDQQDDSSTNVIQFAKNVGSFQDGRPRYIILA
jgi:hypothetical protein